MGIDERHSNRREPKHACIRRLRAGAAVLSGLLLAHGALAQTPPPPVANPDCYAVDEDKTLTVAANSGVLTNDCGLQVAVCSTQACDRSGLTAVPVTNPSHASQFTLNSDGSFSYRGAGNFNGTDSFTYATRRAGANPPQSAATTVFLTVRPINDVPKANSFTKSTLFNTAVNLTLAGSDADNDPLNFRIVQGPQHGTFPDNSPPGLTYRPQTDFVGDDSFTYRALDGQVESADATVRIVVLPGLRVENVTSFENSALGLQTFKFRLFPPYPAGGKTVTVEWATRNGTAHGGSSFGGIPGIDDYLASGNIPLFPVSFSPGEREKTGTVAIVGDSCVERDETYFVDLKTERNAIVTQRTGTGTIQNDDSPCFFDASGCACIGSGEGVPESIQARFNKRLAYSVRWTVPATDNWHSLDTIVLRLIDERGSILTVRWDETTNVFSLLNPIDGSVEDSGLPGSDRRLNGSGAVLLLEDTQVVGSGPTGPSVTLNLRLKLKPQTAGGRFLVQALAANDEGHVGGFETLGQISVTAPGDAGHNDDGDDRGDDDHGDDD